MFAVVALAVLCSLSAESQCPLMADTAFERGFGLTPARHPAPKMDLGPLVFPDGPGQPPVWRLAQWGSQHILQAGVFEAEGERRWLTETPGKRVVVERGDKDVSILLQVNGGAEYDGRYRKHGEFWPHLLIEQRFSPRIQAQGEDALQFALEFRIPHCKVAPGMDSGLDPTLHTAQTSAYFTVHNINEESPDKGEMIWFGIPLFDVRSELPKGHFALDIAPGGGGKFICTMEGSRFWQGNTGDGQWRGLNVDLRPLLGEALQIAQDHGYLKQSALKDLALTSFNLGWEVPGPYDCALEIRGLKLERR